MGREDTVQTLGKGQDAQPQCHQALRHTRVIPGWIQVLSWEDPTYTRALYKSPQKSLPDTLCQVLENSVQGDNALTPALMHR